MRVLYEPVYSTFIPDNRDEDRAFKQALTFYDPKSQWNPKYRMGYWDGCVRFWKDNKFCTGLISYAEEKLGKKFVVEDLPKAFPHKLTPDILNNLSFTGKYSYQYDVALSALEAKRGILWLATNSGKTAVAAGMIQALDIPTLFLVESVDLMRQTYDVFKAETNLDIGMLGGGQDDIRFVTVAVTKSALIRSKEKGHPFKSFIRDVQMVIADECFPGRTEVRTEQGCKDISFLVHNKSNCKVWSFNKDTKVYELKPIVNWYKNIVNTNLIKLHFGRSDKTISSTSNHKYFILNNDEVVTKRADELAIGDRCIVRAVPNSKQGVSPCLSKKQYQAVLGMVLGDGSLDRTTNLARLRFAQGEKQEEYLNYKIQLLSNLINKDTCFSGKSGYSDNKILYKNTRESLDFLDLYNDFYYSGTKRIDKVIDKIDPISLAFWVMDDGSFNQKLKTYQISTHCFSFEENKLIATTLFSKFGIKSVVSLDKRVNKYYQRIGSISSIKLSELIAPYVHPSMDYKLFDYDKNKFNFVIDDMVEYGLKEITNIESVPPKRKYVYNIEVEDNHNYIVSNNILVSNCHASGNYTYSTVLQKCINANYRYGLSGTPLDRGEIDSMRLIAYTGPVIERVTNTELIDLGVSAKPTVYMHKADTTGCANNFHANYPEAYSELIVYNDARNKQIVDLVKKGLAEDKIVMILVKQIAHGRVLQMRLESEGIDVDFCFGGSGKEERYININKLRKKISKVLIMSRIGETGIDIPSIDVLIRASGGKSTVSTLQSIGRGLRAKKGQDNVIDYHDFIDSGNSYLNSHSKARIKDYEREGFEIKYDNN